MKKRIIKVICKYGAQLCALALIVAPLTSEICRARFYQPEEPKGLEGFVRKSKMKKS